MAKGGGKAKGAAKPPRRRRTTGRRARDRRLHFVDQTFTTLRLLIHGGIVVVCLYFMTDAVKAFAGKDTEVNSALSWAFDASINQWIGYSIAAVCGTGWWRTRRTNKRLNERYGPRISELEAELDPGRSSSKLQRDGTPRKEDRDG